MTWDFEYTLEFLPLVLRGLVVTVQVTLLGMAIALVVGLFVAVVRRLKIPVISQIFSFYVLFVRGTPLLVQLYVAYYILPDFGIQANAFVTGVIVIGLNYSSYTAEVYRSGIEGVAVGQWEAAKALSLPPSRLWGQIILPQGIRAIIPILGNYLIQMFKDSAVLSAITVVEMMQVALSFGNSNYQYLEPLTVAGLLYVAISYPASALIRVLERRFATTQ
ncbi:ectoine/hydroxyectoine ABC transporter permease subunit EhuD [Saxibacter everestensis]|uniref:Ectoine/hydroxyectoine ABC transporter permease subunit EhuD n=1 Tax=Saxibacter everestensis TaxID=2909229 RepID=A0ABY8QVR7_9MICO|nr:ectoine/hydroxyectoine ABC transporter permease subunit EhuD [Brevibacteriaceae bacterium ZFBP1038]